ncbi:integrator complex subunit 15-like isoform X2 [Artemia franciscana]|uniref:integrator complex subunit 15-like isoform X2 n=1 Tax=Artemia franciscana TaxID=6661 RepID=UPI0032DA8C85
MQDQRQNIRRVEFPKSTKEALHHLEQLCIPFTQLRPPTSKQLDYIGELIDEFVFLDHGPKRAHRRKKMTSMQELQVLVILCRFFSSSMADGVKNTVFMMIFTSPGGKPDSTTNDRMLFLGKLISLAISMKSSLLLNCAGVWMQQRGCSKEHLLGIAKTVSDDHFVLSPNKAELTKWVELSPHFTSCFLSTVSEIYGRTGTINQFKPPPRLLLEVTTEWIASSTTLALAPLLINLQPLLPKGSIVMTAVTPFVGLIRWCVEIPLLRLLCQIRDKEEDEIHATEDLESKLLLGLLESMNEKPNLEHRLQQPEVVSPRQMCILIKGVAESFSEIPAEYHTHKLAQTSLDRLGQALQIALASGCLYGNTHWL